MLIVGVACAWIAMSAASVLGLGALRRRGELAELSALCVPELLCEHDAVAHEELYPVEVVASTASMGVALGASR